MLLAVLLCFERIVVWLNDWWNSGDNGDTKFGVVDDQLTIEGAPEVRYSDFPLPLDTVVCEVVRLFVLLLGFWVVRPGMANVVVCAGAVWIFMYEVRLLAAASVVEIGDDDADEVSCASLSSPKEFWSERGLGRRFGLNWLRGAFKDRWGGREDDRSSSGLGTGNGLNLL